MHDRVRGAVPQHEPQRVRSLWEVGAAASPPVGVGAIGQVAAQVAGAVAGGVAAIGEALAEGRLGLHDDLVPVAIEEEVVVLGREGEAGAGVKAEGVGRPSQGFGDSGGVTTPHGGVGDDEVGVGVIDGGDGVSAGGRAEEEAGGVGAD